MKKSFITLLLFVPLFSYPAVFAVETAPRISDREIVEGLSTIRGDINELRATIRGDVNELRVEIKRLDERFGVLQWMLGLFITVAISLMGIMGRILWTQQKRLTQIETTLEAQKEEMSFIKALIEKLQSLIEKLLPPRSVL